MPGVRQWGWTPVFLKGKRRPLRRSALIYLSIVPMPAGIVAFRANSAHGGKIRLYIGNGFPAAGIAAMAPVSIAVTSAKQKQNGPPTKPHTGYLLFAACSGGLGRYGMGCVKQRPPLPGILRAGRMKTCGKRYPEIRPLPVRFRQDAARLGFELLFHYMSALDGRAPIPTVTG